MKKEEAKPADAPIDYSAFKGKYVKMIIGGEEKREYTGKVIKVYGGKVKINLSEGIERTFSEKYIIPPPIIIERPENFKAARLKTETNKRKGKKKDMLYEEESEKKDDDDEEKDDENLEDKASKDE